MSVDGEPEAKVDLAHEPDFDLGAMHVSPSACRVRVGQAEERLEPRVMQVLVVLARADGATVTRETLIGACWEGRIVSDDAIARIIAKLRSLGRERDPYPFTVETIPKVGFRLIASDVTYAGATAAPGGETSAGRPPVPARLLRSPARWLFAAVALVVLLAAGAVVWLRHPPSSPQPALIEVMAFEARADDPVVQRLAIATGEGLVRVLSSAGAEVAPRLGGRGDGGGQAVFRLAGSVDRTDEGYVINAQFIDRESGVVLWSGQIGRTFATRDGLDDEAAATIGGLLQCALEDRRRFRRPMPAGVFTLYLNACDAIVRQDSPQRMLAATRQLVEAAPGEPTAHAMYGIAQAQVASYRDYAPPAELEALRRGARASAERAIRLDPETPKAYIARANSYPIGANWAAREADYRRVAEIDPAMGPGRIPLIFILREVGRLREGLEVARLATQLADPRISGGAEASSAFLAAQTGDLENARRLIDKMRELSPDTGGVEFNVGFWWEPDLTKAREIVHRTHNPSFKPDLTCLDAYLDRLDRARDGAIPRGLPAACESGLPGPDWRVRLLARQGDIDGAYAAFSQRLPNSRRTTTFLFYPELKGFRADPRFMPLAKSLGLVDYWTATGHWPDFCSEPDLPYDCRTAAAALGG